MAIAVVALLSRLHFAWFPVPEVVQNLPAHAHRLPTRSATGTRSRRWWRSASRSRSTRRPARARCIWRAAAAGCVPLLALCAFLTASRGGVIELVLGVRRCSSRSPPIACPSSRSTLVCGAGSALLVAAADQRPAVRDGLRTALAAHQGNQLIVIAVAVASASALLVYAIALVERHVERPRWLVLSRRQRDGAVAASASCVALVAFVAAGGPASSPRVEPVQDRRRTVRRQRRQRLAAPPERLRQGPLPVLAGGGAGRRAAPAHRHRRRHVRLLVGARRHDLRRIRRRTPTRSTCRRSASSATPASLLIGAFIAWILALRDVGGDPRARPRPAARAGRGDGRRRRLRVLGGGRVDLADPGAAGRRCSSSPP